MDHSHLLYSQSQPEGMALGATIMFKRPASHIANKRQQEYSKTISWIRCNISFSLIRSAVMCLRWAQSSLQYPARSTEEPPLDLAIQEGRIPTSWATPGHWTLLSYTNFTFLLSPIIFLTLFCTCIVGIQYTSCRRGNLWYWTRYEVAFSDLSVALRGQERLARCAIVLLWGALSSQHLVPMT